jgi:hypothetical protein
MELNTRSKIYLEWMFENQPQLVRDLHRSNKLEPHLEAKYQRALELTDKFKKEWGMSEDKAFEAATSLILAPSDGPAFSDNAPEPLPLKEQEAVYKKLEAIDQAQRRMDDAYRRRKSQQNPQ